MSDTPRAKVEQRHRDAAHSALSRWQPPTNEVTALEIAVGNAAQSLADQEAALIAEVAGVMKDEAAGYLRLSKGEDGSPEAAAFMYFAGSLRKGTWRDRLPKETTTRTTEVCSYYQPGLSNSAQFALDDRIKEAREVYEAEFWGMPVTGKMDKPAALGFGAHCILSANARHHVEAERRAKEHDALRAALAQARREWTPTQGPTEAWLAVVATLLPEGTLGTCTECGTEEPEGNLSVSGLCARCWLGPKAEAERDALQEEVGRLKEAHRCSGIAYGRLKDERDNLRIALRAAAALVKGDRSA